MNIKFSQEDVIREIRKPYVKTEVDLLRESGFTLKFLGGGLFRNAYRIVGTKLVVKVPIGAKGRRHSQGEMKAYRRIMRSKRKYTAIQLYMPEVLAYNAKTGIVLMPEYRMSSGRDRAKLEEIAQVALEAMGKYCDLHKWNVGKGKLGDFRIIDLGYFVHRIKPKPRVHDES